MTFNKLQVQNYVNQNKKYQVHEMTKNLLINFLLWKIERFI